MQLLDPKHPFFAKTWVRWFWTLLALGMGVVEFLTGSPGWGIMFLAAGGYLGWVLILNR